MENKRKLEGAIAAIEYEKDRLTNQITALNSVRSTILHSLDKNDNELQIKLIQFIDSHDFLEQAKVTNENSNSQLLLAEIEMIKDGHFLLAVKSVHVRTNIGLKASKDLVDHYRFKSELMEETMRRNHQWPTESYKRNKTWS